LKIIKEQNEDDKDCGIRDEDDLKVLFELLKSEVGKVFNTNVIRIALNMQEEKIASVILAHYYCKIDEEMVLRAIKTSQLHFL
jgi:hypothetical protein